MKGIRPFATLCAECGLFQPTPPKGYILADLNQTIRHGALAVDVNSETPRLTGYGSSRATNNGMKPRTVFKLEAIMRWNYTTFAFFNPLPSNNL